MTSLILLCGSRICLGIFSGDLFVFGLLAGLEQRGNGSDETLDERLIAAVGCGYVRNGHTGSRQRRSHRVGKHRLGLAQVGYLIDKAPGLRLFSGEPAAYSHQVEQVGFGLAALGRIHRGNIVVEFVEVTDCRLAVVTDSCELVGIEASPLEKLRAALVHEVHGRRVDADVPGTERSDGCGTGIHPHEVDGDIAMTFERRGDGDGGRQRTAEAIDEHVDRLALVLGKHIVHVVAVEVVASDIAFEVEIVSGLWHSDVIKFCHKIIKVVSLGKRQEIIPSVSDIIVTFAV